MSELDLQLLLRESRRLNHEHAVTGLLLYVARHFMQCIEGAPDAIGQLADNIRRDDRNEDFVVLIDREVQGRTFPGWTMGFCAYTMSELRQEDGFQNIRQIEDLDQVEHKGRLVFGLLRNFYETNLGSGL